MNETDTYIIEQIKRRRTREHGFRVLLENYQESMYWVARRIVVQHADADDVLQNAFIKVVRSIDRYQGNSSLYTWMYRIVVNESIDLLKKSKKYRFDELDSAYVDGFSERLNIMSEAFIEKVLVESMEILPTQQKIVFQMRYFDDLPFKEISSILQKAEGTIKANYHHAVRKMEAYIKKVDLYE